MLGVEPSEFASKTRKVAEKASYRPDETVYILQSG